MEYIGIIEGILYVVGDEGISFDKLKEVLEIDEKKLEEVLNILKKTYENEVRGFRLELLGNKYKLVTKKEHSKYYEKLIETNKKETLTQSALETLAVIAYNSPITRSQIDEIRGVDSVYQIKRLLYRNLIKEVGKSDLPGKPTVYQTTEEFLKTFGISNLDELPELPRYRLDENEQIVIDDIIDKNKENQEE